MHHILHLAGGQQAGAHRTGGIQKVDGDGRGAAGHAVDTGFAVVAHLAARRLYRHVTLHAGIEGEHAEGAGFALRRHQAALQREGHHRRQHVAAVGRGIHRVLVRLQLGKQEVQVHAGLAAAGNDADLAGQRVCSTQAVNLAAVGRAHDSEQHTVAQCLILRQVICQEDGPA